MNIDLTLVRHTSVAVEPGVCYGRTDVPLLEDIFPIQAESVSLSLAGQEFERVFTSPLSRCMRLARACGYPDAEPDPRLAEMDFGEWEMQRWDHITDPRLSEWYADWLHVSPTGGESFLDQQRRLAGFISDLRGSGCRRALVFTHGGIIMQAMLLARTATLETIFSQQPPYASVTNITI